MNRLFPLLLTVILALALVSCSDDDPVAVGLDANLPDLTARDGVLESITGAYSSRDVSRVSRVLPDEFVFVFGAEDAGAGATPQSWNKSREVIATTNLFARVTGEAASALRTGAAGDVLAVKGNTWGRVKVLFEDPPNPRGNELLINALELTVSYDAGENAWEEVPAPKTHDGETWFRKDVIYTIRITTPDITFIGEDIRARFIVRKNPQTGRYELMQWQDAI